MRLTQEITREKDPPKITVITVVFNGRPFIERTILSVIGQTYSNLEYIVIDGGSTDGTIEIIKRYGEKIDYWHSETDAGIYDAMNIGLGKATGRWVNFMNAGDTFHKQDTVAEVFATRQQTATVIYGAVEIVYPNLTRVQAPGSPEKFWQGMQFCHQSAFIDVAYHQAHPFNIVNKIAADFDFFYQAYCLNATFLKIDAVISTVIAGGVSDKSRIRAILEWMKVVCNGRICPFIRLFYYGQVMNSIVRSTLKRCLPRGLTEKLILMKR